MDVHVPGPVSEALLRLGVDVLTAQADGTTRTPDPALLDRATDLGRVLVTSDKGFFADAVARQRSGKDFTGIIYAPMHLPFARSISDLELMAQVLEPSEVQNTVRYLPLP
jgi:hypothetical protein